MNIIRWAWIPVFVVIVDQLTKMLIRDNFFVGESITTLLPFFDIAYVRNYSVAAPIRWLVELIFGASEDIRDQLRWTLAFITATVSIGIIAWIVSLTEDQKWMRITLALILGGAIGNLIDRVWLGYVVDFLDFHYRYHFPAFNIADSAITVGAIMLIYETYLQHKQEKAGAKDGINESTKKDDSKKTNSTS